MAYCKSIISPTKLKEGSNRLAAMAMTHVVLKAQRSDNLRKNTRLIILVSVNAFAHVVAATIEADRPIDSCADCRCHSPCCMQELSNTTFK